MTPRSSTICLFLFLFAANLVLAQEKNTLNSTFSEISKGYTLTQTSRTSLANEERLFNSQINLSYEIYEEFRKSYSKLPKDINTEDPSNTRYTPRSLLEFCEFLKNNCSEILERLHKISQGNGELFTFAGTKGKTTISGYFYALDGAVKEIYITETVTEN